MHVVFKARQPDFDRAHQVTLQHLELVAPWVLEHKSFIENKFSDTGRRRTKGDVTREHNSSFTRWFKEKLLQLHHGNTPSTEEEKLLFALSQGPAMNVRTYQAYDINGYTFYTEKKDQSSEHQNSGVTMLSYVNEESTVNERFFRRIEEIWELNYCGEKMPMFWVRWAKNVEKEGRYFTSMVIPEAKSSMNVHAKNEPWVLASQIDQCFFITDPVRSSCVVVRRGKRSIIETVGAATEQDFDKYGDPKIEE
jgi:hypothetical protein